jgi:hypothetical protein
MMGGSHIPPQDPQYAKVESARRAELLRQGKSTDGAVGVLVDLLMGVFTFLSAGLARLWHKRR